MKSIIDDGVVSYFLLCYTLRAYTISGSSILFNTGISKWCRSGTDFQHSTELKCYSHLLINWVYDDIVSVQTWVTVFFVHFISIVSGWDHGPTQDVGVHVPTIGVWVWGSVEGIGSEIVWVLSPDGDVWVYGPGRYFWTRCPNGFIWKSGGTFGSVVRPVTPGSVVLVGKCLGPWSGRWTPEVVVRVGI